METEEYEKLRKDIRTDVALGTIAILLITSGFVYVISELICDATGYIPPSPTILVHASILNFGMDVVAAVAVFWGFLTLSYLCFPEGTETVFQKLHLSKPEGANKS